jgi:hypothetical protein
MPKARCRRANPFTDPVQKWTPSMNRSVPRRAFIVTLALTLLVYWIGLYGPLLFDDRPSLIPVAAWLEGRADWISVMFGNTSGLFGRPVSVASFMANGALSGAGVWGLKLGNVLIHLFNGALVFALFGVLIRCGALTRKADRSASWMPWLGASIWLLHPLMVSTVLYVVQRMAMLSALFTLAALLSYVHGRIALVEGRRQRALALLAIGVPLCTLLASLSKENGILAPALCAIVELFVFQPAQGKQRPWPSRAWIGLTLVLPAFAAIVLTLAQADVITVGYANRPFTLIERLLTQPRVLWDYVGALMLPNGPRLGIYHDDYVTSLGLFDPPTTALAIIAWIALLAAAWRVRREIPGLALGVGIFLVGQALESTVFALLMYFEHRNYLPAVGLVWAVLSVIAFGIDTLRQRTGQTSRLFAIAGCALVLVLTVATAARASVWRSKNAIMQQALVYHPNSRWLRQDLIAEAMGDQPPDFEAVHSHSAHLLASNDPSTRRLGAVERVLVDCVSGTTIEPAFVGAMFEGRPEPLEADLVAVFELLGQRISATPCSGLSADQMAENLDGMLNRSQLSPDNSAIRQLHSQVAQLRAAANKSR